MSLKWLGTTEADERQVTSDVLQGRRLSRHLEIETGVMVNFRRIAEYRITLNFTGHEITNKSRFNSYQIPYSRMPYAAGRRRCSDVARISRHAILQTKDEEKMGRI